MAPKTKLCLQIHLMFLLKNPPLDPFQIGQDSSPKDQDQKYEVEQI